MTVDQSSQRPTADGTPQPPGSATPPAESLSQLLGGRRAALDATLPPVVFVAAWWLSDGSVRIGALAALIAGGLVAVWRWHRGSKPRAVLIGLLATVAAALIALYTGRAADFFLLQVLSNAGSALVWMTSIVIRWPLLGVVVGTVLGQGTRWRHDPVLLRAYGRASWVWVCQYLIRLAVFLPLWAAGQVVALGMARVALTWPLVAACLAVSWWVLRRNIPAHHPGLRHPQVESTW